MTGGGGNGSDDCTATKSQVLAGYTAITKDSDDEPIAGTIPIRGASTITPSTGNQTIGAGQYLAGEQTIASLGGNATAPQVLSGVAFSSDASGRAVAGTMPNRANATQTWCGFEDIVVQPHPSAPDSQALITVPNKWGAAGYYDGSSKVTGNIANLTAANIKAGVRVGRSGEHGADNSNTITGTYTSDATAAEAHILRNYIAYGRGEKMAGEMPNLSAEAPVRLAPSNPTPVLKADAAFVANNTDGVKRLSFRYNGTPGYIGANTLFGLPAQTKTVTPTAYTQTIAADPGVTLEAVQVAGVNIFRQQTLDFPRVGYKSFVNTSGVAISCAYVEVRPTGFREIVMAWAVSDDNINNMSFKLDNSVVATFGSNNIIWSITAENIIWTPGHILIPIRYVGSGRIVLIGY